MAQSQLLPAGPEHIDAIVGFLCDMQKEIQDFDLNEASTRETILRSFDEGVHWFLFKEEGGCNFGVCHLQSVHNYWRKQKRYYLGAFYIDPAYRKQGRFRELNKQLQDWVSEQGGVQIYMHIHKDNEDSLGAFAAVGATPTEYLLCAHHWGAGGPHETHFKGKAS